MCKIENFSTFWSIWWFESLYRCWLRSWIFSDDIFLIMMSEIFVHLRPVFIENSWCLVRFLWTLLNYFLYAPLLMLYYIFKAIYCAIKFDSKMTVTGGSWSFEPFKLTFTYILSFDPYLSLSKRMERTTHSIIFPL